MSSDQAPGGPEDRAREPVIGHTAPLTPRPQTQAVLNESWPLRDKAGQHARGIPDQPHPIPVEVRVVLENDGEHWMTGRAQRWTKTHVFVAGLADERLRNHFVWVRAGDVRRVSEQG